MSSETLSGESCLKRSLKQTLRVLARNDLLWNALWLPMARFSRHMTWQRSVKELHRIEATLRPTYEVQDGIFAGMRYPHFKSIGSALLAKLMGTYEAELAGTLSQLLQTPYDVVVDVGCAEGYYAVGLALKLPAAQIFAYDTDAEARDLCREMAQINQAADRVTIGGFCASENLATLVSGKRALIISDCEGGEQMLFDPATIARLAHCDLLIEAHDFIHRGISRELQERFRGSHDCQVLHSMGPLEKAARHPSPLVEETSQEVTAWLYNEGRPEVMEWLCLTPRAGSRP